MIVKIIGSAPFAVSIILTIFMGGLGLGSYIAGRTIDRISRPIRLVRIYGILELVIGAYALAIPLLLSAFKPLFAILYNQLFNHFMLYNLLTLIACSIILSLPVICMGATLPILCRFYVRKLSHLGTHAGRLYGLNTIGAALGALLCGFWLINLLGMTGTLIFAVLVNGLIGMSCLLVRDRAATTQAAPNQAKKTQPSSDAPTTTLAENRAPLHAALIIFAVSGFCSMAYEVIWTKLLGLIIGPTSYSFTIVLVTFILGLALGSMIFGRLADKTRKTIWLLICTQIAAAFLALAVSQLLGNSQLFFAKLIFNFKDHFALLNISKAVALFVFMILPTLCLGATFPLVGKIYTQSVSKVGRSIGLAYAVNTIGAVSGSFCAGFVLIPLFGKETSLSLIVTLQLLVSLIVAAVILHGARRSILKWVCVAAPALVGLALCVRFPLWNPHLLSQGIYYRFTEIEGDLKYRGWLESLLHAERTLDPIARAELAYYGDGIGGFTTVRKYTGALGDDEYIMTISGKSEASSRGDMATQTIVAHLPMLFHHNPKKVMVLGLGSGITAGEVLCYDIDRLDVIDINKQVIEASDLFLPWNNNLLADPKTNLILQDGRAHLQLTKEKYDVIISEPSNPWMAGLAALFTRDSFILAKNGLNQDGIFCQWLHSYEMDWPTFALIGRTFAEVFPNSLLLVTEPSTIGHDYLLIGLKGSKKLSLDVARANLPAIGKSKNVTLADPALLYRLIVSEDLTRLFGPGHINTDSRPRLEFSAPKLMHQGGKKVIKNLKEKRWLSPETMKIVEQVTTNIDTQIDFAAYAVSLYEPFNDMVDLSKATPSQKQRFFNLMETYAAGNPIHYSTLKNDQLKQRCIAIQIETILSKIELLPDKPFSYFYLGNLYYRSDRLDESITAYSRVLELEPDFVEANNNLGRAFLRRGKIESAIANFEQVLRIKPYLPNAHINLARAHIQRGNFDQAITHFTEALRIKPDFLDAHNDLATTFAQQGKFDQAIEHYIRALQIEPAFVKAHSNLGALLAMKGDNDRAITHFTEALRIDPEHTSAHSNLARTLVKVNRISQAITHFKEALRLQPNSAEAKNDLAWIRATQQDPLFRDPNEAVLLAQKACRSTNYKHPEYMDTLAAAYAAAGKFPQAAATARDAIKLARSSQNNELTIQIQNRLHLYQANRPYIVASPKPDKR